MTNDVFDAIIPWLREPIFWAPIYLFVIGFCLFNFRKKGYFIIVFLALAAGSADFISNTLIKKNVERLRPCRALEDDEVIIRVHCGSGVAFAQVYVGVHYPLDVISGALLGVCIAYFWSAMFRRFWKG